MLSTEAWAKSLGISAEVTPSQIEGCSSFSARPAQEIAVRAVILTAAGTVLTIGPNGTLYVVWCSHTNNHADVWATRSTDGGMTWSAPVAAGHLDNQSAFFASVSAGPPCGGLYL